LRVAFTTTWVAANNSKSRIDFTVMVLLGIYKKCEVKYGYSLINRRGGHCWKKREMIDWGQLSCPGGHACRMSKKNLGYTADEESMEGILKENLLSL
jgi:hypothetical protein